MNVEFSINNDLDYAVELYKEQSCFRAPVLLNVDSIMPREGTEKREPVPPMFSNPEFRIISSPLSYNW